MSKRPVIVKKTYITNYYNRVDNRVTNNDNRVTNNHTYVVRTSPRDQEPRQWVDEAGVPRTNVANVSWKKADKTWRVRAVDAPTRKLAHVGLRKDWDDAVRAHA